MGLMGTILHPLYSGFPFTAMSPLAVLQKPVRWLQAMSITHATTSGGPNFAYELCLRRVRADDRKELDLSRWEIAFNGSEPVRAETLDRFARCFSGVRFSTGGIPPMLWAGRGDTPRFCRVEIAAPRHPRSPEGAIGRRSQHIIRKGDRK